MAEMYKGAENPEMGENMEKNLERLDVDLDIMEKHAAEMARAEQNIQEDMRKWDREYKDAKLHSVPKARKHLR